MSGRSENEKVGMIEIIFGSFFTLGIWAILLIMKVFAVGLVLYPFIRAFGLITISMWLWSKGDNEVMKWERWWKKILGNAVPFVPTLFLTFLWEVHKFNNPKDDSAEKETGAKVLEKKTKRGHKTLPGKTTLKKAA